MLIERRAAARRRRAGGRVRRRVSRIGGERGYGYGDWLWEVRGAVDRLAGGVGLRRGRRDARDLRAGDALDFWRVEAVEPGRLLRLRAEMKVPGQGVAAVRDPARRATARTLVQTAYFAPKGLPGLLYWYALCACPRADILGYDCRAGRRGQPAGSPPWRRFVHSP